MVKMGVSRPMKQAYGASLRKFLEAMHALSMCLARNCQLGFLEILQRKKGRRNCEY